MNKDSSKVCGRCDARCCSIIPFLTQEEKRELSLNHNGGCDKLVGKRCSVYDNRPIDCRIFPISIYKIGNSFYWVLTKNCPLSNFINVEKELGIIEKVYLPSLKDELENYHRHPWTDWFSDIKIIKKIK
ncbi:MAG: hypothetical protein QXR60_05035, partial [Candidatus Nanoarchaeia archaeon]